MRINSIHVIGYRGIREFTHNFQADKAFVQYGINGSGKTSLYQALYFALTGELSPIIYTETASAIYYRHKALADSENAYVKLNFSDAFGNNYWIERTIDVNGNINTSHSVNFTVGLLDAEEIEFLFLNRNIFSSMIDAAEKEAWSKLSPLLGFPKIAQYREGLRNLSNSLKQDLNVKQLEDKVYRCQQTKQKLENEVNSYLDQLSFTALTKENIYTEIKTITSIELGEETRISEINWAEIESKIPGAKELGEINKKLNDVNKQKQALKFTPFSKEQLVEASGFMLKLHNNPALAREINLSQFYKQSKPIVQHYTDENCPLCDLNPADWESIRANLEQKYLYSQEIQKEYSTCNGLLKQIKTEYGKLSNAIVSWLELPDYKALNTELTSFLQVLDLVTEKLHKVQPEGSSESEIELLVKQCLLVNKKAAEIQNKLELLETDLLQQQACLSASEGAKRIQILKSLCAAALAEKKNIREFEICARQLKKTQAVIEKIKKFSVLIDAAEDNLNTNLLLGIETELKTIFNLITNQEKLVPKINIFTERKIRKAEILIEDFHGLGEVLARNYLSEAYRNTLGLSIYFASLLTKNQSFKAFILDDITHSTDYAHRRMLSRYIVYYLKNHFQLFIFTHDDQWYDRLEDDLNNDFSGITVKDWNIDGAVVGMVNWKTKLDNARAKITAQEKSGGYLLRMAIEDFMDNLCEELRIKIQFKKDAAKVKFEEKKSELTHVLKDAWANGTGIIDPNTSEYIRLTSSQKIANMVSHDATYELVSIQTLEDTLQDVDEFVNIFKCKNTLPNGTKCNAILKDIIKRGSSNPECRTCKMPFLP